MLQVVFPHSLVLRPIHMFVDTAAVRLVIGPVAVVNVAVHVDKSAFPVGSVLPPLATVFSSIVPGLLAKSISEASLPLACVDRTCLESVRRVGHTLLVGIVCVFGDGFSGFFLGEVLAATHLFGSQQGDEATGGMSPPISLQLDDHLRIRLQEFVVVLLGGVRIVKPTGALLVAPTESLELGGLVVHVEFGVLSVLAHAVGAVSCTISHFKIQIIQICQSS